MRQCWEYAFALLCRAILFVTGWHVRDACVFVEGLTHDLNSKSVTVGVISHPSYWDYVIAALSISARPALRRHVVIVVADFVRTKYWYAGWLFRLTNVRFVKSIHDKSAHNTVQQLKTFVQQHDIRLVLIVPSGSTDPSVPWRRGYFWLAHELQAHIGVYGIDYSPYFRCVRSFRPTVSRSMFSGKNVEDVGVLEPKFQMLLRETMDRITPLYQPASNPKPKLTIPVDMIMFTSFLDFVGTCWVYFSIATMTVVTGWGMVVGAVCAAVAIGCCVVSMAYHYSYEQSGRFARLDRMTSRVLVGMTMAVYAMNWYRLWHSSTSCVWWIYLDIILHYILIFPATLWSYKCGTPRKPHFIRLHRYEFFHSIFHVLGVISLVTHWGLSAALARSQP